MGTLKADISDEQENADNADNANKFQAGMPSTNTDTEMQNMNNGQDIDLKIKQYLAPLMAELTAICQEDNK